MAGFLTTYQRVSRVIYIVAAVLLFLFFLMTAANVVARYLFNAPILVGDEVAFYLFVYFAILGIYYAYGTKAHISVDLVTSQFSERIQTWLRVVTVIFEQVIWVVILWQSVFFTFDLITRTHRLHAYTLKIPVVVTFVVVPVTAFFILLENTLSGVIPRIEQLRKKLPPS
jgi:TRAP-type C4-dicarboxylate transport system permease small subunit